MTTRRERLIDIALIGVLAGLVALLLPASALAQGCSMCKTALDGPLDPLSEAFNVSTLFLLAAPYTVVGTFGAWIVVSTRRRARAAAHDAAVHESND